MHSLDRKFNGPLDTIAKTMSAFIPFVADPQIHRIGRGLLDRTLPKPEWTHAAHFAAALWILRRCPEIKASRAIPAAIRAYNEATGVANTATSGYHETITQASIRAGRWFLETRQELPLWMACNELMASPLGQTDWLLAYWSKNRLFSEESRRIWVAPDVRELPF